MAEENHFPALRDPLPATSALGLAALLGAIIEWTTDTPGLGPFYRLTPATTTTSALSAAGIAMVAALLLLARCGSPGRHSDGSARRSHSELARALVRLLPLTSAVPALLWTRKLIGPEHAAAW